MVCNALDYLQSRVTLTWTPKEKREPRKGMMCRQDMGKRQATAPKYKIWQGVYETTCDDAQTKYVRVAPDICRAEQRKGM